MKAITPSTSLLVEALEELFGYHIFGTKKHGRDQFNAVIVLMVLMLDTLKDVGFMVVMVGSMR